MEGEWTLFCCWEGPIARKPRNTKTNPRNGVGRGGRLTIVNGNPTSIKNSVKSSQEKEKRYAELVSRGTALSKRGKPLPLYEVR